MWTRRSKQQLRRAANRDAMIYAVGFLAMLVLSAIINYFRFSKMPNRDAADVIRTTAIHSIALASLMTGANVAWRATENRQHRLMFTLFPGTQDYHMLCLSCWGVENYRNSLICSNCGGHCEDAKLWTWVDQADANASEAEPNQSTEPT